MTEEWFRQSTWSEADRKQFYERLQRAKHKSQYLRIQAVHLAVAGHFEPAIELLEEVTQNFPDSLDAPNALLQKAKCLASIRRDKEAILAYEEAVEADRRFHNIVTDAWLDFASFILEHEVQLLYKRAIELFQEFGAAKQYMFPIDVYRHNGLLAILKIEAGDVDEAKDLARTALHEAEKTKSGLRYHQGLGLVPPEKDWLRERLETILAA